MAAITPMQELDWDARYRGLLAAQEYLRGEGLAVGIVTLDEAIHRFIKAYNNGSSTPERKEAAPLH